MLKPQLRMPGTMSARNESCDCAFHTAQPDSPILSSPDLSVSITDDEAARALSLFDGTDWDLLESRLPVDASDTSGEPLNRHNRNIRLMILAESVSFVRSAPAGEGVDLMNNKYYEQYINALLDAYDSTQGGNR